MTKHASNVVQVGDHMPEPRVVGIHPRIAAELHAIRATSWSVAEYRALADRFADAAQLLQIAVTNENFAGIRSASLTLDEIAAQTAGLNDGLRHAIENAKQAAQQKVYRR
jgi:hypothetical protein